MSVPIQLRPIPLWDHWNEERLRARHADNPRAFDRGFRLKAYSDDEATFPSFKKCRTPGLVVGDIQRNRKWPSVIGVDLSSKKRPGNAIAGIRVDPVNRYRFPCDIKFLAKPGPEVCDAIQEMDDLLNPVVIMVEDNGYQDTLMDWIGDQKARYRFWVKVEATTTYSGRKNDPERGLPGMEVEFRNGAWKFPYSEYEGATKDEPGQRGWWARLDYELRMHPISASTDGCMALWFGRQGIEQFLGLGMMGTHEGHQTGMGDLNAR